jgi:PRTRC genetic system protein E
MNVPLISLLAQVIRPKESVRFTVSKQSDCRLLLVVQPLLRKMADDVPKEAEQTRAALSVPLRLVGTPADLDLHLVARLEGYCRARGELNDNFDALVEALKEASKEAKNRTTQARKSTVAKPKGVPSPSSPPAPSKPANADSTQARSDSSEAPVEDHDEASTMPNCGVMQPLSLL